MKDFKIGLDIHGTIDTNPLFFSWLTKTLAQRGVEIHITTGKKITDKLIEEKLKDIRWHKLFSITDYHEKKGTKIDYDEKGDPWIDPDIWDRSKAEYCRENKISLHIDDSGKYGKYFTTPYIKWKDKENVRETITTYIFAFIINKCEFTF